MPLSALKMAIDRRRPEPGLIHHSDRGIQYTSQDYRNQLDENAMITPQWNTNGARLSMS